MRLRVLAVGVLCAVPMAPAAAGPLDPPVALVVTGNHSATATFTITARTEYRLSEADVTYAGRYVAVMIEHVKGRSEGGIIAATDFNLGPQTAATVAPPTIVGTDRHTLQPGTYRAYLLTDGTATVTFPLSAGSAVTVRPNKRVRATYAPTAAEVRAGATTFAVRSPLGTTNTRTKSHVVAQYRSAAAPGLQLTACITAKGKQCADAYGVGTNNSPGLWATHVGVGDRGRYPATTDARSEGTVTATAGGTLTLAVLLYDRI